MGALSVRTRRVFFEDLLEGWTPARVAILAAILYGVYLLVRLVIAAHGNAGALVIAGSDYVNPKQLPIQVPVTPGTGYDGQFYFRLALAPFNFSSHALGVTLDGQFRFQRIVYPLVAWLLSGGSAQLLLYVMPLVNLVALIVLAWVVAKIAADAGKNPLFGLLVALYPGYAFSLGRDTTEPLAGLTLSIAVLLLTRRRHLWAALAFSVSVLTRETGTLVIAGVGLAWLYLIFVRSDDSDGDRKGLFIAAAVPTLAFAGWQLIVRSRAHGFVLTRFAEGNLGLPLRSFLRDLFLKVGHLSNLGNLLWLMQLVGLTIVVVLALAALRSSAAPLWLKISLFGTLLLVLSLSGGEWRGNADLRSLDQLWLLSWFVLLGVPRLRIERWAPLGLVWAISAAQLVLFI